MSTPRRRNQAAAARSTQPSSNATIKVGIGGWVYESWRDSFYPPGLVQRRELEYASRQVSAIEINGTYYSVQRSATYARWRDETPADFVFSAKAPRRIMASHGRAGTGSQIEDFIGGIAELGPKLGPLVWQFDKNVAVEEADFAAFLALLPRQHEGIRLRHVVDLRNPHLANTACLQMARRHRVATVFTDSDDHPSFADITSDFIYARLMRASAATASGYAPHALDSWARRARLWSQGEDPGDLPHLAARAALPTARDVFLFLIGGAKEKNPAAAVQLLRRLGDRQAT